LLIPKGNDKSISKTLKVPYIRYALFFRKLFDSTSPAAKKNPSNSNRFGNLEVDHFGSPNRAQKNFRMI